MKQLSYSIVLNWKMDLRNRDILIMYYIVPIVFFIFMGGIFTSIMPDMEETLIQAMSIFGISMGAYLGGPLGLVSVFGSNIKKAYQIGQIPHATVILSNLLSGTVHLFLMQLVILLMAPIAFDAVIPENLPVYLLNMLLFIGVCMMLGTVLGVCVKKQSLLTMLSQALFLPSVMLSGIMFPSEMLPSALQKVSLILPATWGYRLLTGETQEVLPYAVFGGILVVCIVVTVIRLKAIKTTDA